MNVEFLDPVYGEHKKEVYASSKLFVLPTFSENFGLTVAEALSVCVPVIVTKGAPWECLERVSAGWWIDIGFEPLAVALMDATQMPDSELELMGQRGRALMQSEYSWDSIAYKMSQTYLWMMGKNIQPTWVLTD
jgi:glycosyltransferase involved in cell wall biosynthesis